MHDKPQRTAPAEDRPRNVGEFRHELRRLREECGNPSSAELIRLTRNTTPGLKSSTLSEFKNDVHPGSLPARQFVAAYVAGCLRYAHRSPEEIRQEVDCWLRWRADLVVVLGKPVSARSGPDANGAPVGVRLAGALTAPGHAPRVRRAALLVLTGAILGIVAGIGFADGWWSGATPDPSLAYGICAEAIQPSRGVGHVALLADTGPRGKPVQDRRIELRVQKHPERGWIAWAYLERTPSDLDRLWLDWSYLDKPGDQSQFRQCGAQPVTEGKGTPGILVTDQHGRDRWFRACGQAPAEDRAPDHAGTFCTSWTRPRV